MQAGQSGAATVNHKPASSLSHSCSAQLHAAGVLQAQGKGIGWSGLRGYGYAKAADGAGRALNASLPTKLALKLLSSPHCVPHPLSVPTLKQVVVVAEKKVRGWAGVCGLVATALGLLLQLFAVPYWAVAQWPSAWPDCPCHAASPIFCIRRSPARRARSGAGRRCELEGGDLG